MIRRRSHRMPALVPVAAMGDIAFLLIIFFVLTTNFIKEGHVRVEPPRAVDIEQMDESPVSVVMDEDGNLWLQGAQCSVEILQNGVEAALQGSKTREVMLKIDRNMQEQDFQPVLMALSKAGATIKLTGDKRRN
jgi:biopolymer transport protein ExbD